MEGNIRGPRPGVKICSRSSLHAEGLRYCINNLCAVSARLLTQIKRQKIDSRLGFGCCPERLRSGGFMRVILTTEASGALGGEGKHRHQAAIGRPTGVSDITEAHSRSVF